MPIKFLITKAFYNNLMLLWSHLNSRRKIQIRLILLLMFATSLMEVIGIGSVLPFLSVITAPGQIFNNGLAQPIIRFLDINEPQELLIPITVIFAVIALITGSLRVLLLWAMTRVASSIGADLSISAYRRTLYQPYIKHLSRNSSTVIAGINGKTAEIVGLVILPILIIINACVMFVMVISALVTIAAHMAFIAFGGFAVMYVLVILFTKEQSKRNGDIINLEANRIQKALQEGLGGIRDVLIDGTQEVYCKTYQNSIRPMRRASANIQIISGSPRFVIEAFGMVLIASIALIAAKQPEGIETAIPLIGVLVLSAQRLLPLLQQSYASWTQIRSSTSTLNDTLELLNQPLPEAIIDPDISATSFKMLTLKNISFQYGLQTEYVLRNINLTIEKGARIGIIGKTGSGKSTFLDLIMGLLTPTQGYIGVDDQELTSANRRRWQNTIAHVPQAIYLADVTIAENIAFGVPFEQIDNNRLKAAAAKAQIAELVTSLPYGYNTIVGERGVRLSGGQRQRIGIARALYKKADVIIFDEATSALDNQTELAVMSVIDKLSVDLTVIIVAHRITTLQGCTKIIEIENGEISWIGSYSDLKVKNLLA